MLGSLGRVNTSQNYFLQDYLGGEKRKQGSIPLEQYPSLGYGALPGKMLLVRIIEYIKIDAYFSLG